MKSGEGMAMETDDRSILDVIEERRKVLSERAEALQVVLDPINSEIRRIDAALMAMRVGVPDLQGETLQQSIMRELRARPNGIHLSDLLAVMQRERPWLVRTSLSPQLSRLMRKGETVRSGRGIWRATINAGRRALADASTTGEQP